MKKKRSQRFEPVVKVAENREQEAARVLGSAKTPLTDADQRLTELATYREQYINRLHRTGATGMPAAHIMDKRLNFINTGEELT